MSTPQAQARKQRKGLFGRPPKDSKAGVLWETNQADSPLLRLPAEIRNRIYELVLDVGQIHVMYRPPVRSSSSSSFASASSAPSSVIYAPPAPSTTATDDGQRPWGFWCAIYESAEYPWKKPFGEQWPPRGGITLLSAVCRQMYEETALLPFQLNVWSFERMADMERFITTEMRLPKPQRRALHTIAILPGWIVSKKLQNLLVGLQTVHVWEDFRGPGGRILRRRKELPTQKEKLGTRSHAPLQVRGVAVFE